MATITQLLLYPVKSCRGIALERAILGHAGLEILGIGDREWMVVDADGQFLTQREEPGLACVTPTISASGLVLAAPGVEPLPLAASAATAPRRQATLWGGRFPVLDGGNQAADWISGLLHRQARLVRFDPAARRESDRSFTPGMVALNRFSDGFPMLVLGEASLRDLNDRLERAGRERLPMDRFRPNIVLEGLAPYDEDFVARWTTGDIVLRPVKPCPRCAIPSVDQSTGKPGPDPREVLSEYRLHARYGIVLGQNTVAESGIGSELHLDQALAEEWSF